MNSKPCAWVNDHLLIDNDGYTRPCCGETFEQSRISKISDGIVSAFNHPKLIQLKKDLEDGFSEKTRPYCRRCEITELNTNSSLRLNTSFLSSKREIKKIQFKLSNKCQLACAHCGPNYSSTWTKLLNIKPHVTSGNIVTEEFLNELSSIFDSIEILKFTGGEPFLDPDHWKILEHLKPLNRSKCVLEYITNGLVQPRYDLFEGWKAVNCLISVDGYEKTYEWFRRKSSWEELNANIETLKKHTNAAIIFSITPYTIQDYFASKRLFSDMPFYPNQVVIPEHCNFFKFPKSVLLNLPNIEQIPFALQIATDVDNLAFYKDYADSWDKKWNTYGQAKELFFWYN